MRNEPNLRAELYKVTDSRLGRSPYGANWGRFKMGELRIISSGTPHDGDHIDIPELALWEHVSVSCASRCPTWDEMSKVKEIFFRDDETVVQFHPKKSAYVNFHPYTLHLWRRIDREYALPPRIAV